ncbi:ATP-binding protein [uncultured Pseudoteredinibacter sp.]|uniref:PAS domain-containing sensor histidine kinase n=1 Tax=uncultured Pseudoteredinibacter sp. TaxID=1641701 RepID=UPI002607011E|nr:ATP-binding protein [uncultured Pseudoteredinibacter sp.]
MKVIETKKDAIIFSVIFIIGCTISVLIQNSEINEQIKQKKFDFEAKISSLTLIIGDTFKSKENYSKILASSISEIILKNSFDKNQIESLVKDLSIHESFYLYDGETNQAATLHALRESSKFDLKPHITNYFSANNSYPDQFSILIKPKVQSANVMCISTKIPESVNMQLIACCSINSMLSNVIERSSEDWQKTHVFTGDRLSGFSSLYTFPVDFSQEVSLEELRAANKNIVFLPYAIKYANKDLSIAFDPGNNFYQLDSWSDFLPFIFSLTLTLILLYYVRYQSIETQLVNHKVDIKTKELNEAKLELESEVEKSQELYDKLQESNSELSSLTNSIDGILWEGDPVTMRYNYISEQVERILGYPPECFTSGDFIIGSLMEGTGQQDIMQRIIEGEDYNSSFQIEFQSKRIDNKNIWLKGIISRIFKNGRLHKLRGVYLDISKQKEQELKNQEIEAQLRQSQKLESIGQLAAGIAHEVNTPAQFVGDNLNFIGTSCQELIEFIKQHGNELSVVNENYLEDLDFEFLQEELPDAITQSKDGLKRINKIVSAMKNFSHPDGEEKQKINLNKAIESTSIISKSEWKYTADLKLNLEKDLPPVSCFPGELNQVFLNMIVNSSHAIEEKYKGEKMGLIEIITRLEDESAVIEIKDDGIGIPQEIISKVFDPFFTTKGVGKGTGQGLSISYSVIKDKHKGTVNISSEVGEGTTFTISLPIDEKPD